MCSSHHATYASTEQIVVPVGVSDIDTTYLIHQNLCNSQDTFLPCTLTQLLASLQHSRGGFSVCSLVQFNSSHGVNIYGTSVSTTVPHTIWDGMSQNGPEVILLIILTLHFFLTSLWKSTVQIMTMYWYRIGLQQFHFKPRNVVLKDWELVVNLHRWEPVLQCQFVHKD